MPSPDKRKPAKNHTCTKCGKSFVRPAHLREHEQRAHEGVRYQCSQCHKHFSTKSYRDHHQSSCQGTRFTCMECGQEFERALQLQTHQRNIHPRPSTTSSRKRPQATASISGEESATHVQNKRLRGNHEEVDPIQPEANLLPQGEDDLSLDLREVYQHHWSSIRTHHRTGQCIQDVYNYRLQDVNVNHLVEQLQHMFRQQRTRFKVNASFGFVLRNIEMGELRYYHSSHNQGRLLEVPHMINNQADFDAFLQEVLQEDILEWAKQQWHNTKWVVVSVTNLTVFVNKLPDHPIGCADVQLPDYIKQNSAIIGLALNARGNVTLKDNLCFFRAVALHQGTPVLPAGPFEAVVRALFSELIGGDPLNFEGVHLCDLPLFEKKLQMNINVFELVKNDEGQIVGQIVQRTHRRYTDTMNLNLFEDHFSLITSLDLFSKSFSCRHCGKVWKQLWLLKRHEKSCTHITKKKYVGGSYQPEPTVFELLADEGIIVDTSKQYYPYRITYDFESYFDKMDIPMATTKSRWEAKHVPLSVSICSNVPGFTTPQCFITEGDTCELVTNMVKYMHTIQETATAILTEEHHIYYTELDELLKVKLQLEMEDEEGDEDMEDDAVPKNKPKKSHPLYAVKHKYDQWIKQIPVIGFNSAKYDINIIKTNLVQILSQIDPIEFVVKKSNAFMCLQTERLKFLDIRNYLAPGFDYATYLKAYQCVITKGYFPYEWMDNLEKLKQMSLPSHEDFFSTLKNCNISEDEYAFCQQIWKEEEMTTIKDYLIWYNNRDVVPFLEALEKQFMFYCQLGVDMFKDGISVPGLTLKYLFKTTNANFTLYDSKNSDLHELVRDNMVGGPSIIFHRYHEAGLTQLRSDIYKEDAETCESIVGYDANALYLWCLMQDMPVGTYVRRREEDHFKPHQAEVWGKMAMEWMEWEASQKGIAIRHKYNSKEKRIGQRQLPVDGWCAETNTVYQFHGCFWHGHECMAEKGIMKNEKNGKTMEQLRSDTQKNSKYIQQCGYHLKEIWECEWKEMKKTDSLLRQFLRKFCKALDFKKTMSQKSILEAVNTNDLFGMVECDIRVPDHLKSYFAEMTPIFKNVKVSRDDLGESMKEYATENKLLSQPRRTLIGSYIGKKVLLATPLLKWYLEHGLIVTHVYQVIEYTPEACFQQFGNKVSQARRNGDADPDQAIIADTMKLLGNSGYGKTITNKDNHRNIYFCDDREAPKKVNEPQFRQLNPLQEDFYEVEMAKKVIKYDLPVQIGFFVYQYAKLRMLQFYYDFLDQYLDRKDYQYMEMDTDSAYIAIAAKNIEDLVKPHLKKQFYQEWNQWLPAEACTAHHTEFVCTKRAGKEWHPQPCCVQKKKYDKRTPGLFKVEWEGTGMVGLCSKTYYGWGEKMNKCSTKGIDKKHNQLNKKQFLEVLMTKQSTGGINVGFQVKDNTVYTYRQERNALS